MISRKIILLITGLLALCLNIMAAPIDDFNQEINAANDEEAVLSIISTYLPKLSSVEDLRTLQNVWMQADEVACRDYFAKQAKKNKKSEVYQYLNLRFDKDPELQMDGAIQLCKNSPKFYWGYRLLSVNFMEQLLDTEQELANPLEGEEYKLGFIDAGIKEFPDDPYLNIFQFHRYRIAKENAKAEAALNKVNDSTVFYSHWKMIYDYLLQNVDEAAYDQTIAKMIHFETLKSSPEPVDSVGMYHFFKASFLVDSKKWDQLDQYFSSNPQLKDDPNLEGAYQELLMNTGKQRELVNILSSRYEAGKADYFDLNDDAYAQLDSIPGWKELVAKSKATWMADINTRRTEALLDRIDEEAPLWELPDKDGRIIKLADQKGKIVVLDFWATWCGPCRMVMPILSKWMSSPQAKDVLVYSINVWDKGNADKAKQMFIDEGYNMTLLFGDESLSKQYGFDGIPYLCVIDKTGKLAFAHTGASPTLDETLGFWVEELRQE